MRHGSLLIAGVAWLGALGCGDSATAPVPGNDGRRLAAQFERLADSVAGGGDSPTAVALRHAAEIVRLTGHATPVTLTIDGTSRSFLAVAEQIDFPNLECSWPSDSGVIQPGDTIRAQPGDTVRVPPVDSTGVVRPDSGHVVPPDSGVVLPPPGNPPPPTCTVVGTFSMRTLIAWEPETMAEVVRVVGDVGSNVVAMGVPDVMTGLPAGRVAAGQPTSPSPPIPPDSTGGGGGGVGGFPGFMGEYLVRDVGSWWAAEGNQTNDLAAMTGACTADHATFDWAEFSCEAARFRFEFNMRVEPLRPVPLTGRPSPVDGVQGSHEIALGSSSVDGARLTVIAWTPPPLPPGPLPIDSTGAVRPLSP